MRGLVVVALLVVAGCKKHPPDPRLACRAAADHAVERSLEQLRTAMKRDSPPLEPAGLRAGLTDACVEDRWPAPVIECFAHATELAPCKAKLTPEQRAHVTRHTMTMLAPPVRPAPPAKPAKPKRK
ncbi:MAG TPA: hypothetical protein VFQ53_26915 [Kofleriaceae bacterium]|nr:hypothetical protein [Kofleriaceae bacterium]